MKRILALMAATILLMVATVEALPNRTVLLSVEAAPSAWADSHLKDKLIEELSASPEVRVLDAQKGKGRPPMPQMTHDIDSLVNWGREIGGKYLLAVEVHSSRLETKKTFNLPLIAHRYKTSAIIAGRFRLIDLSRGKQLASEPFELKQDGPSVIQAAGDGLENDPDLHLTPAEKILFFERLEIQLAKDLAARYTKLTRGR